MSEVPQGVRQHIENRLHDILRDAEIRDVSIDLDDDGDGFEFLSIRVLYDDAKVSIIRDLALGVPRALIQTLAPIGEYRFPLISYISLSDLNSNGTESSRLG